MKLAFRLLMTIPLLGITGFCVFGFLATFEALPPIQQWIWRLVYFAAGFVSLLALIRLYAPQKPDSL